MISLCRVYLRFLRRYAKGADDSLIFAFVDPVVRERQYRVWDLPTEIRFLSAISDQRERLLFSLLVFYGLRIGELLALKGSDFEGGFFTVRRALCEKSFSGKQVFTTPKTKRSVRTLPVVSAVAPLLVGVPKSWLFPSYFKGVAVMIAQLYDAKGTYVPVQFTVQRRVRLVRVHFGERVVPMCEVFCAPGLVVTVQLTDDLGRDFIRLLKLMSAKNVDGFAEKWRWFDRDANPSEKVAEPAAESDQQ